MQACLCLKPVMLAWELKSYMFIMAQSKNKKTGLAAIPKLPTTDALPRPPQRSTRRGASRTPHTDGVRVIVHSSILRTWGEPGKV